jgi:hypothetical protein
LATRGILHHFASPSTGFASLIFYVCRFLFFSSYYFAHASQSKAAQSLAVRVHGVPVAVDSLFLWVASSSAIRLASVSSASPVADTNSRTSTLLDSRTCGLQTLAQANYLEKNRADGFLWLVIHQSVGCFWSSTFRLAIHNDKARLRESDLPALHLDLLPPCRQPQVLWQPLAQLIFVDDEVREN